jgi:hypothetical protein
MLADAKLPHKFWAETLSTSVYLRNGSLSVVVKGKTPLVLLKPGQVRNLM